MSRAIKMMRSAGVVGVSTLASRVTGLLRDMVTAYIFGTGPVAEAFYVAFMIPNQLRRMVGEGSLVVAFIPVFTKFREERGEAEAQKLLASFWTLMIMVLVVLTALGMIFSKWIVYLFTNPAYRAIPGQFELAVTMNTELFPYLFLIGLVALAQGILNTYKYFFSSAVNQVLFNLAQTVAVIVIAREFIFPGFSLVIGVLVGGALQLALQIPYLWKVGMRFKPSFNFRHPAIKRIGLLMIPSSFAVSIVQINTIIATYFITAFQGARTQYYNSNRLTEFPYAIFSLAIATVILPALSEHAAKKEFDALGKTLNQGLKLVSFIIIPASVGMGALAHPIIQLIYQHGQFQPADTDYTAQMLIMFCVGLWATAGLRLVMQAYYAVEDMVSPLWSAALAMVVNAAGCWYLSRVMGRAGVPLTISLAAMLNLLILWVRLPSRIGSFKPEGLFRTVVFAIVASAIMGGLLIAANHLSVWTSPGHLLGKVVALALEITAGMLLYAGLARIFRVPELNVFVDAFMRRLRRPKK